MRSSEGLPLPLLEIHHEDLDETLQLFYSNLVKADSQPYEPTSLRTMLVGLDRFFRDNGKAFNIQSNTEFETSYKVLNGKAIELKVKQKKKKHALTEKIWSGRGESTSRASTRGSVNKDHLQINQSAVEI